MSDAGTGGEPKVTPGKLVSSPLLAEPSPTEPAPEEPREQDLEVVGPRLRELRQERNSMATTLAGVKVPEEPPRHVVSDATIERFRTKIRDIFISGDTPMTKTYLKFLLDEIVVHDDRIEIHANSATPSRSWRPHRPSTPKM